MNGKYPELMTKHNERFETLGSHIGISDAEAVKELTNLDLKILTPLRRNLILGWKVTINLLKAGGL